ncbi:hypothetical protein COV42_03085 [Candidatus Campbellbacteria bacterium CG11_big_fil_rev_8_21_14_0_20_44_21]|uniref:Carbamoyltransferase n=1 Tax=Candidatus Campbellbacteria bacterium CG22_combo_CG10-13_8_21_14_all_43_18 TaxID=1974530 RepID=A0A2H0DXW8_9BACT|nr:MAG: hypothetical protein COW82_01330 [Candidatus Campbellbacteria bacterium CG22_combo_CG10-13_8_21_14_all_43_18]PIR24034.1 MAG: hypothetical protein COV42_03085 [Candidatus Campbellbacteria bacterium CG11_big_fil_rev_8_21_14_0_20_44_21]
MYILGISAYYHDSAACLIKDGEIVAAAQEERFSRKKHDAGFPTSAIAYCLEEAGITSSGLDYVAFYDKPFLKFERILESYLTYAPKGVRSFLKAVPLWIKKKLWIKELIKNELNYEGKILFPEHHLSHAASAFYPSPYEEAAILTMDGVGEWATTSYGLGEGNKIELRAEINFPHSLGLLYSAFTYYLGFKVNSGEYKVMGLAPYGEPKYKDLIFKNVIDVKEDGSFKLNMKYFSYVSGLRMTNKKMEELLGAPRRKPESKLEQVYMDIARSLQEVTEEIVLKMAGYAGKETGKKNLVLAGGVALNCVANGKLLREKIFENIWIQPASGDAGGALGAALAVWHDYLGNGRKADNKKDRMSGGYLGPSFSTEEVKKYLDGHNIFYQELRREEIPSKTAELLKKQNVIGWFQGRMEFGPRALGARSIIGDARSSEMQRKMNLKIKFRESFRPFAPSVLIEKVSEYFDLEIESPYMLLVAQITAKRRKNLSGEEKNKAGLERLQVMRSDIPAITHVDSSARIQTVHKETNPLYHKMISELDKMEGCGVIVNTSFNVRGEPIVSTPEDAYKCFMRTRMDYLIMENFILDKREQPERSDDTDWKKEFELD